MRSSITTKVISNYLTIRKIVDRLRHGPLGFNALDRAVEAPN